MVTIKHENLIIHCDDSYNEELLGWYKFDVDDNLIKEWFIDSNGDPCNHLNSDHRQNGDVNEYKLLEYEYEEADIFICLLYYFLNTLSDREIVINIKCSHIFWILHDIKHSENDTAGYDVTTNYDIELIRIIQAFEWCDKLNIECDNIMIETISNAYIKRFSKDPQLERFYKEEIY